MNLSQVNNQDTKAKAQAPKEQVEELETISLKDIQSWSSSENLFWDKQSKLEAVDVVRIDVRPSQFKGELRKDKNGHQIWEFMFTCIDQYDNKRLVCGAIRSNLVRTIALALKAYVKHPTNATKILGYCIDLECTGKKDNAYIFEAKVLGDANHEVEGIFDADGNEMKEED